MSISVDDVLKIAQLVKEASDLFEAGMTAAHNAFAHGSAKLAEANAKLDSFHAKIAAGDKAADDIVSKRFDHGGNHD